jgi:arylsulfatase A-like enzyme
MKLLAFCGAAAATATQPHLLFMLVDDLGYNDFTHSQDIAGAWPTTSKLAASECIAVSEYYTQPICTPSRGAFATGRYPGN